MLTRYFLALALLFASTQVLCAPTPQDGGGQPPAQQDGGGQAPAPQDGGGQAPAPQGDGGAGQNGGDGDQQPGPSATGPAPSGSASDSQPSSSASSAPAQLSGEISSDIPLSCIAGCSLSQSLYEGCVGGDNPSCTQFCTTANYTQALTCLNCLVTQGSSIGGNKISSAFNAYTGVCKRVRGSRFRFTPTLSASPTTTEGTSTSLGEGQGLPTWEGFSLASGVAVPTDVGKLGERIGNDRQQQ